MASIKIFLFKHKKLKVNKDSAQKEKNLINKDKSVPEKEKDALHPVVLQVIKDRQRRLISLGYSATEAQWIDEKQLPNNKHPLAAELKRTLRKKKHAAEKIILEFDDTGLPYSVDDIVDKLKEDRKPSSFKQFSDSEIDKMIKKGKRGNAEFYRNATNALLTYLDKDDIDFRYLNARVLENFRQHLLEKGTKINSISVYLRTIRAIYNKAIKGDIVSERFYPFKKVLIKQEPTAKRALTKEEIAAIKTLDLSGSPDQEFARDIFLFSFYNRGMNYIDICYLKKDDIVDERIRYRRQKTGQIFSIKLTEQAAAIIEKYIGRNGDYVFPLIKPGNEYNSYRTGVRALNRKLKKIGKTLELRIPLSSYVARHSWATIAKHKGIPIAVISEGLGHDSEQTTQIYLDSFEDKILDDANDLVISSL